MFIRPCRRTKNGKTHAYWALVESYRTQRGPRQRVVAYLGSLDRRGRLGVKQAAQGRPAQRSLLDDDESFWIEVDATKVRVENSRQFGGPWLGLELARRLHLPQFLEQVMPSGREDIPWSSMAMVLVLSRLCEPSSELYIAEHFYRGSALADLLGVPETKINTQRLYRGLDALLPHKPALERHLKDRLGTLFDLDYDLLLYDVTSTYFEGEASGNPLAQRGYSRDHRRDCKQVCIGLVVSRCGLPLGYEVFAGNRHDVTTLREIVETMESRYGQAERMKRRILALAGFRRPIAAVIRTHDSEASLPDCLARIGPFVDGLVIEDQGSTDRTLDIAREYGAEVANGADVLGTYEWLVWLEASDLIADRDGQALREALSDLPSRVTSLRFERDEGAPLSCRRAGEAISS